MGHLMTPRLSALGEVKDMTMTNELEKERLLEAANTLGELARSYNREGWQDDVEQLLWTQTCLFREAGIGNAPIPPMERGTDEETDGEDCDCVQPEHFNFSLPGTNPGVEISDEGETSTDPLTEELEEEIDSEVEGYADDDDGATASRKNHPGGKAQDERCAMGARQEQARRALENIPETEWVTAEELVERVPDPDGPRNWKKGTANPALSKLYQTGLIDRREVDNGVSGPNPFAYRGLKPAETSSDWEVTAEAHLHREEAETDESEAEAAESEDDTHVDSDEWETNNSIGIVREGTHAYRVLKALAELTDHNAKSSGYRSDTITERVSLTESQVQSALTPLFGRGAVARKTVDTDTGSTWRYIYSPTEHGLRQLEESK